MGIIGLGKSPNRALSLVPIPPARITTWLMGWFAGLMAFENSPKVLSRRGWGRIGELDGLFSAIPPGLGAHWLLERGKFLGWAVPTPIRASCPPPEVFADGQFDRFVGREFWRPPERFKFFGGVAEARHVADPAARTTGVTDARARRGGAHDRFGDGPHGAAALRRGDVEAVQLFLAALENEQHGVHQLTDMQIRLLLQAVAQDFQFSRVGPKLFDKIKNRSVRGAAAHHVWEAANPRALEKPFQCGGDDAFGRQLHRAIV